MQTKNRGDAATSKKSKITVYNVCTVLRIAKYAIWTAPTYFEPHWHDMVRGWLFDHWTAWSHMAPFHLLQ